MKLKCTLYSNSCKIVWKIEKEKEKFDSKRMERNFRIFQTEGSSLSRKDSSKYFS